MGTIWIVGGGTESIPGLLKAREMGHLIVVSDGSSTAPGLRLADESFVIDTYDAEQTAEAAVSYRRQKPLDGVMAMGSDVPETVATVAEALDLPGPGRAIARIFSDKLEMKEYFKRNGIGSPWFQAVGSSREAAEIIRERGCPMVLKPADSRGARGVIRITPDVDVEWAFTRSQDCSPTRRVIIEEWLEGQQISTESILYDGRVTTPGLSDRNYEWLERFRPYVIEDGGDLPARLTPAQREELDGLILRLAEAFGIDHWTLKGDVVWTSKGPRIIEAALRLSGGYFCSHTAPLCSGVDVVSAAIRLALGEALEWDRLRPRFEQFVCQRYLFPPPGEVISISGQSEAAVSPGVRFLQVTVRPGSRISPVTSHPDRGGTVVTVGRSREEALERARQALRRIRIEVKPLSESCHEA